MKSKGQFAKRILVFMFAFITLYTIAVLLGTYLTGIPEPSSLTVGIFGLFGVETVNLMIKKLKGGKENESNNNYDDINDSECGGVLNEHSGGDNQGATIPERYSDKPSSVSNFATPREPWYIRIFRL